LGKQYEKVKSKEEEKRKKKREKKKNGEKLNKQVYFISLACIGVTNLIMSVGENKMEELKIQ
jgi:hypothetical protein